MDVAGTHILVVDDYVDAADSTVELLSMWGYDAIACYSGATALESACLHRPDAVLLDVVMPPMSGFQFAGLFRELPNCGTIPIIALSGYFSQSFRLKATEVGIKHYLLKPADPEYLKDLLARTIEATAVQTSRTRKTARRFALRSKDQKANSSRRVPSTIHNSDGENMAGIVTEPQGAADVGHKVVELMLLLPTHQFFALEQAAFHKDVSVGRLLRRAISDYLRQLGS